MAKTLKINGVDFTNYFTSVGYNVGYESVEGQNSGKMLNGSDIVDEIALHAVISLPCMPLNETQLSEILSETYRIVNPMVYYFDPKTNSYRNIMCKRTVSQQKYKGFGSNGNEYWTGTVITFTENPL